MVESGLKALLEASDVLKVLHDVRRVAPLLAHRYGLTLRRVFDTQIAHTIIQHDKLAKPIAEIRAISFINLQRVYFPQALLQSDTPAAVAPAGGYGARPITDEILLVAVEECHSLVTALYRLLNSQLPDRCRRLFDSKCVESCCGSSGVGSTRGAHHHSSATTSSLNGASMAATASSSSSSSDFLNIYRPPARRAPAAVGAAASENAASPLSNGAAASTALAGSRFAKQSSAGSGGGAVTPPPRPAMCDSATQTLSTGEITVLQFFYE